MTDSQAVHRLLAEAAKAPTLAEQERLVGEAELLKGKIAAEHRASRDTDLANAIVAEALTPAPVHEMHTASTDWLGGISTTAEAKEVEKELTAQASLWYSRVAAEVKSDQDEFEQQAFGHARKLAGAYGEQAELAESSFLGQVEYLYSRDLKTGSIQREAASLHEDDHPSTDVFPSGAEGNGLPGDATTSERAPVFQQLQNHSQDVVEVNDPGLGKEDPTTDQQNQDEGTRQVADMNNGKQASATAACPTCSGKGRVAVRQHTAYSGLPQIDQIVNNSDTAPEATPYPADVAFPWVLDPKNQEKAISETEQFIAEREQRKGASRLSRAELAAVAAREAFRQVMAGQDDSGWAGDNGAKGNYPGVQEGGNAPSSNLNGPLGQPVPDEVYGNGGDQGDRALKPYGADEANDYTNNPGMNWQPTQPTQYDQGTRQVSTDSANQKQSFLDTDPEIQKARDFIMRRIAWYEGR